MPQFIKATLLLVVEPEMRKGGCCCWECVPPQALWKTSANQNCHHRGYAITHGHTPNRKELSVISELSALTTVAQFTPAETREPSQPATSFFKYTNGPKLTPITVATVSKNYTHTHNGGGAIFASFDDALKSYYCQGPRCNFCLLMVSDLFSWMSIITKFI